jgi:trk system potassium uptake protein TrkA
LDEVMDKQFAVIGLGNFGYYLAVHLYEKGHEVLAIDKDPKPVQEIKDKVSRAVVADATDRNALDVLELKEMDTAVVCIGSILSDSILATLNLKDIGTKRVLAMALSDDHGRILEKVGASEVFLPEKDMAIFLGERLHNPNMLDYIPFVEGYSIIESAPPKRFIGQSLRELDLINQYGIQVVAIKESIPGKVHLIPTAGSVIKENDILILLGPNTSLDKLREIDS